MSDKSNWLSIQLRQNPLFFSMMGLLIVFFEEEIAEITGLSWRIVFAISLILVLLPVIDMIYVKIKKRNN